MAITITRAGGSSGSSSSSTVSIQSKFQVKWNNDVDFNKGTNSGTQIDDTGEDSIVTLADLSDSNDAVDYTTEANYTLSDGSKLAVESGTAKLKAGSITTTNYPLTTDTNYTFNSSIVEVVGGEAVLKDNYTNTSCIDLDGVNEYVDFGDVFKFDFNEAFSMSLWINPDASSLLSQKQLFSKTTKDTNVFGYTLHLQSGELRLQARAPSQLRLHSFGLNVVAGSWQHVVLTYDGSSNLSGFRCYLNGVVGSTPSNGAFSNSWLSGQSFELGRRSTSFYYDGKMDEFSVWSTALSSTDVTALYNSGKPSDVSLYSPASASLEARLRLGDGDTHPILTDSINSNDGTLINTESGDIVASGPAGEGVSVTNPTVVNNTALSFTSPFSSFTETSSKPINTDIKYHISVDDGVTYLYHDGASWTSTDGSLTQSNTASEVNTYISTIGNSGDFKFRALLSSTDGVTSPSLDDVQVVNSGAFPTEDNLYIDTKDNDSQITATSLQNWLTAVVDASVPGSTDLRILLSNDGRSTWLTYSGGWTAPASSTTRTDAASITDVQTNFSTFPIGDGTLDVRVFLYSSSTIASPSVDSVTVTGNRGKAVSGTYTSNEYNCTYEDMEWGIVNFTSTDNGSSTATLQVRAGNTSGSLGGYTTVLDGDTLYTTHSIKGQYLQWRVLFTGDGVDASEIESVKAKFTSPEFIVVNP